MKSLTKIIFLFMLIVSGVSSHAQTDSLKTQKAEFNVAPYFNYNTTSGAGFGLLPMLSFYMDKEDEVSPRSTIGLLGYYNTKKSFSVATFGNFYLAQDNWRVMFALGTGTYNFQTFIDSGGGEGAFVDYGTDTNMFALDVRRRIFNRLYGGLGFVHQKSKTTFDANIPDDTTKLNILMLELFFDDRNSVYYPTKGNQVLIRWNNIPEWLGNDEASNVIIANYNRYLAVTDNRDVVAMRFHIKAGLSDLTFQQQPMLRGVDLRGYSEGKYRGDGVMDVQGEYRWNFKNKLRFSAVGFAGLGTLYGADTDDFNWKLYPSIGGGIRWTALKSNHMNVGIDAGVGKDDWGIYFRIGEAF
ncbi:MAG: BamA/TamA family outer membrane protein [Flavobacteriaceae bacterium]